MTTIFLHVGVTSFPDPGDWNPYANFVDCVGSGGAGSTGTVVPLYSWQQRTLGGSGGSGTYARGQNLTVTFPVPVSIAAANAGGMTWFNGTTNTPPNVYAPSGSNANGTNPGAGGAIGYPVSRAGNSSTAALISQNQPGSGPGVVWYGRASGGGGAGGLSGNGRFGSQYYNANGISWGGQTGPSYGGAPNATSQDQQPYPLDQNVISGNGTTDTSIWGDPVIGLGGGGNGGGEVFNSPPASPQAGMAYFDGANLYIFSNASPGPGWFPVGTSPGSLNGGNGGLYGGGGGGASLLYSGQSGAPGNGADGIIAIIYTPFVPLPPGEPPPGWKREFLDTTSGQMYWPDPGDWDPNNNKIECVGAGGYGAPMGSSGGDFQWGGGGGGGGAYAYADNVPLTFPVPYWIPTAANTALAVNFNVLGNAASTASGCVSAGCGVTGANGSGAGTGSGGLTYFPNGSVGGNGGFANQMFLSMTGGGGGAAGPTGAGGNGTAQTSSLGGQGGSSDGNTVSPGQSGTQWGVGRGTGGGGNGAVNATGSPGASYGGGGAGGATTGTAPAGGAGMIILTWKPLVRPQGSSRFVVAG